MSHPVKEFMTTMPQTIGHEMSVSKATQLMEEYSCHHLPVLSGGSLCGVVSDRDLAVADKIETSDSTKIMDIMTEDPVVVAPEEDVFQVAMLMHQLKIGSVIVSATENEPWGIFTATDALAYFSKSQTEQ